MVDVNLYWTVVTGIVGAIWVLMTFVRDRRSQSIDLTNSIFDRLLETDQIIIANPDIPRFMSGTAAKDEEYFRSEVVLDDQAFFKSKTYIYRILNTFDQVLSIAAQTKRNSFLNPAPMIEPSDWETYILLTLRHPLYRSVLENESDVFGDSLREFWEKHKGTVRRMQADRFVW